jgi:hypothetical protein
MFKVKGKVTFHGAISTLRPPGSMTSGSIVFLPLTSRSRIHLQRHHASCRCARPLPAKAGTISSPQFCHQSCNSRKTDGFFDMPQSWDMGHIFYFPSEGRHTEDFLDDRKNPTASAGFEPANSGSSGNNV